MSGQITHEEVLASELPPDLADRIVGDIGQFSVGLFGIRETNAEQPQRFCGSGTLVVAAGTHFVLTAAHVWEALKSRDKIGITLRDSYAVIIDKEGMSDVTPGREKPGEVEWGPDLSLLRLPADHLGSISAVKTFYNLSKKRRRTLGLNQIEMWLLLGAPREYASFPVNQQTLTAHASLQMTGFLLKQIKARHHKNGFDYVDMEVNVPSHNVPSTFWWNERRGIVASFRFSDGAIRPDLRAGRSHIL